MDYMTLFPSASRNMPRFSALSQAVLSQVNDLVAIIAILPEAYSVTGAVGDQLDALGKSLMFSRPEGLSDEQYRSYLQIKLALYTWDGSNESAQRLMARYLPGVSICDNCDGTITVTDALARVVDEGLYPVPAGVRTIVS